MSEEKSNTKKDNDGGEAEEKMDRLWERFNEESKRHRGMVVGSEVSRGLKVEKAGGGRRRKPSFAEFIKFLLCS